MQYAMLKMASWYHGAKADKFTFRDGLPRVLSSATPILLSEFMKKYSGLFIACHNNEVGHAVIPGMA